jgi:hypothetical protein
MFTIADEIGWIILWRSRLFGVGGFVGCACFDERSGLGKSESKYSGAVDLVN